MSTTANKRSQRNDRLTELSGKAGVLRQQRIHYLMGAGHCKDGTVCFDPAEQLCPQPLPSPNHRNFGTEPTLHRARAGMCRSWQRASFYRAVLRFTTVSVLRHPPGCSGTEFPAETLCRGKGRAPSMHRGSRRGRPGSSLPLLSLPIPPAVSDSPPVPQPYL